MVTQECLHENSQGKRKCEVQTHIAWICLVPFLSN